MGISYDPTKPAANDKPTNDQAPMQTNFASIKTLIDVDHVDFSNAQYGQHNQVTFATITPPNPPTPPVTPPKLFTNTQDGAGNNLPGSLAELFFYSGNAAQSKNQYTSQTNGSVLLMGGIILKWGSYTMAPGVGTVNITFAGSFPNSDPPFGIFFGSNVSGNPNNLPIVQVGTLTNAGFTAARVNGSTGGTYTYYYLAIGN